MHNVSRMTPQKSWQRRRKPVSVLAEMALRREKVTQRLEHLRERHGLTQEQAAARVGITHRQWQRWESGESMPYPRNLDAIASAFGIGIEEFFDPDPERSSQFDQVMVRLDQLERTVEQLVSLLDAQRAAATAEHLADRPPAARRRRTG